MDHKFPYKWALKDGYPAKGIEYHGSKVFSCFSCGGGSTMGYKLAGYDVIGCNEIDRKMMAAYIDNHNPQFPFLEPIQSFKTHQGLPSELFNLDILDGSPPCSSFSMAGNRKKDWGKEKKFREGQQKQVLDTLFFDFIDLAKRLQPKVVMAENVKGILMGDAKKYCAAIYNAFDDAGYYLDKWLLDASEMGVPQRRERVFFIGIRKDLAEQLPQGFDMFNGLPSLNLEFKEKEIVFGKIKQHTGKTLPMKKDIEKWHLIKQGGSQSDIEKNGFNCIKAHDKKPCPVITANQRTDSLYSGIMHSTEPRKLNLYEFSLAGTYPLDYNYCHTNKENIKSYLIGMSVPPVMTAQISLRIYEQWISKL